MIDGELGQKTRRELLQLARNKNIKNCHAMTRGELVSSLAAIKPPPQPQTQIHCPEAMEPEALPPIPPWYGKTRIVLLVRDPNWLFAYWEVIPSDWQGAGLEAGDGSQRILRIYNTDGGFYDQRIADSAHSWYLETGKPGHSFYVEIGLLAQDGRFILVARSNTVTAPPDQISPIVDEAWMTVEELYRMAAGAPIGTSSVEIQQMVGQRLQWELGSGAVGSISSPAGREAQRGFWLVLNAELILYGATEPDAKVSVAGQQVVLNEQGEFSLRFALPDGTLCLPVVANSADEKDQIKITPTVSKTTD